MSEQLSHIAYLRVAIVHSILYNLHLMITNLLIGHFAGKGIQRELFSIYKCATRIFDVTNYVGRLVVTMK